MLQRVVMAVAAAPTGKGRMDTGLTSLVARNRKGPLVLVVDDEVGIVDMIQLGLKYEGYRSAAAFSGPEALEVAQRLQPDVVVLDVMLPGLDGRQVCRKLRAVSDVPVLMLTARDAVPDRVLGLDAGADDYLVKPFAFEELMARLRALLRRRQPPPGSVLTAAGVSLDARTREVVRDGRELRRFAADASHELRTPLTALRGYVEVLLRGAKDDPEDMGHALAAMQREALRMEQLTCDLLDLTRLDARLAGERLPLRLDGLVDQLLVEMPAPVVPVCWGRRETVTVAGNAPSLRRAVSNLLENARRYSPAGSPLEIAVWLEGNHAVLTLRDMGVAIAPEDLPHIFERFYRGDSARSRVTGGSGLGLSIVQAIVAAHGGEVTAVSRPGNGSIFTIRLPAL